jgi:hypothetical protein
MSPHIHAAILLAALQIPAQQPAAPDPGALVVDGRSGGVLALTVQRAAGPIRIDGELADEGWRGATRAIGWTEFRPGHGVEPPVRTEAWLTYDEHYLYVAFVAEADPREIRATLRERDRIWDEDAVGILLDTYGDGTTALLLLANPLGVQADLLLTPQGDDPSFDIIFRSEGRITPDGYTVEMAIPFRSLRFANRDEHTWRINFYRQHPRSNQHQIVWAPLDLNNPCLPCQSPLLHGIRGIAAGGSLELLPAVVASQAGARSGADAPFETGRAGVRPSLGGKYGFTGDWTAEATLNPDFSQVESDAAQIDVNTTFALSYPERRPFFQEGSDLFDTNLNVVYTRAINSPSAAGKLTGRVGENTRIAYLGARDGHSPFVVPFEERSMVLQAGPSVSNLLRVRHGFRGDSHVGLLLTDRRLDDGGSGTNVSLDGRVRFARSYAARMQLVGSYTVEPDDSALTGGSTRSFGRTPGSTYTAAFDGEQFAGHAAVLGLSRNDLRFNGGITYTEASPTYRADVGFQTRNDFRRVTGNANFSFYPAHDAVERVSPNLGFGTIWNFGAERKDLWLSPGLSLAMAGQTFVNLNAIISRETFRDVYFDDIRRLSFNINTTPLPQLSVGIYAAHGSSVARFLSTPVLGRGGDVSAWAAIKPTQRLAINPSVNWSTLSDPDGERLYRGYIARVRTNFQLNRELQVRVVTQYNDFADRFDVEPLIMYRLNPFSIFYIGSTHGYRSFDPHGFVRTDRQLFLKFQYLFRV